MIGTATWRSGILVLDELKPTLPDNGDPYRSIMNPSSVTYRLTALPEIGSARR